MPEKAATMAEVARTAGCHPSTVSLALRDDPRIPVSTRERVKAVAKRLAYRVNPLVAAWVSTRRAGRTVEPHVAAAYITCHPDTFRWKSNQHFHTIYEAAKERAQLYGFSLTEFRLSEYARDLHRLNSVLIARNIRAIIIGPTLEHHELRGFEWDRFSLVTIGYGLTWPSIHRVTEDHHLGMKLAFESCVARGYRRIGLALVRQHNSMRRERWISAYLYEQHQHLAMDERLPIFIADHSHPKPSPERNAWLRREKPDIILADDPAVWRESGLKTMGFALSTSDNFPGIHENNRGIGGRAADLLVGLVLRNETGLPTSRQTILVEPTMDASAAGRARPA